MGDSLDWQCGKPDQVLGAINDVFRVLLANLCVHFENDRVRSVRANNTRVMKWAHVLGEEYVRFLFSVIGFDYNADHQTFEFHGDKAKLKDADDKLSQIELFMKKKRGDRPASALPVPSFDAQKAVQQDILKQIKLDRNLRSDEEEEATVPAHSDFTVDFDIDEELKARVRKTLLTTGRIRNSLFEAKDFITRRMHGGMAYCCGEQSCTPEGIEAHWHLESGKNMVYCFMAHLNSDGTVVHHLGPEYGYQYNVIPGGENFRKVILFSEKLTAPDGKLVYNRHPNKVAESCIYCGMPFTKLMF